jgi:hypothetical protein
VNFHAIFQHKPLQQLVVVLLRGADDWSEGEPVGVGHKELFEELPAQPVPEAPGRGVPRLRQPINGEVVEGG